MYDGASATAEAVLMALRIRPKRSRVILSRALHPQYREVVRTYATVPAASAPHRARRSAGERRRPHGPASGSRGASTTSTAAVVVGLSELLRCGGGPRQRSARWRTRAVRCWSRRRPRRWRSGCCKPPGAFGADIAVAEGQSLGVPMSYGGPGVGLFATRSDVRAHDARPPGRRSGRRRGAARVRADAGDARATHPPREGDVEHLHQPWPDRAGGHRVSVDRRQGGLARAGHRQHRSGAPRRRAAGTRPASGNCSSAHRSSTSSSSAARECRRRVGGRAASAAYSPACRCGAGIRSLATRLLLCVTEMHDAAAVDALVGALSE